MTREGARNTVHIFTWYDWSSSQGAPFLRPCSKDERFGEDMINDSAASGAEFVLPGWEPAPPSKTAPMWAAISAAHNTLERRARYFESTAEDLRLGEQLTLLVALHDWVPVTEVEADFLRTDLRAYSSRESPSARAAAARQVIELVREMARARGQLISGFDPGAGTS